MKRHEIIPRSLRNIFSNRKAIRKLSFALVPLVFVTVFMLLSQRVEATSKFWIGATAGNFNDNTRWSLTSGGPNNTTAPGANDVAFFDAGGLGSCTIAAGATVEGLNIGSGYGGTITVASGVTFTVGATGFSQAGGTFNGGNSDIDLNGNFLLQGTGVFNSTTATLFLASAFDHNTSTNPGGTFNHNNGSVTFDGSNGGISSELSGTVFNNLNFNHTGQRTVFSRMGGGPTITVLGALALNDGQLFGNQIEARGALTIGPNFDGALSTLHATLVIAGGSGARTITFAAGTNMLNVILNDPNVTIQTSGSGTLNWRALTLQAGTVNQGSVDFAFPPNLITAYNQSGGTFNASGNPIICDSVFAQSGGTFNGASGDIDVNADFSLQGTGVFNSTTGTLFVGRGFDHNTASFPGGTFNHNNGTVIFDGNSNGSLNVSAAGETFNNLTFDLPDSGQRGLFGGPFIALGTLALNNGTLFGGTLQPRGNLVIASTFDGGNGTSVTFSGSNNQTFTNNGGANPSGTWTINKPASSVTLLSDLTLGTGQSLDITSGKLDLGPSFNLTAGAITIGANGSLRNFGAGDLTLGSSLTNNGVFNFNGGSTACDSNPPDPILIRSSAGGVARSWSGAGAFSVVDVDVQDQNAAGVGSGITAFSSTNSGNNTNWTFSGGCSVEVTTPPTSQSVCPGVSVNFTVAASGSGLTFQWRKNGVNLINGGNITGATTTMLTINPVGPSDHASYDVVVTNTFGVTATSTAATLTVAGVVTTTADSGAGSLRQAIIDTNACAGLNTITFNIPGTGVQTITPLSALPIITDPVIIDGTSQPGFAGSPLVELNGASAGAGAHGLQISAGGSTVKALVINRFPNFTAAILIFSGGGNTIQGCYIGTNAAGTAALGNFGGISISSASNIIGGATAAERNLISGNNSAGISIGNSSATNNQVRGNFIGTDVTGTVALGNDGGIGLALSASNNVIGGTTAAERNIISGNGEGVFFISGAANNQVKGNFIGTDVTGTLDLGNAGAGIRMDASNNVIGGTTPGERNIISGNNDVGVRISVANNQVKGNFIGTDVTGTLDLGNSQSGVLLSNGAANNLIGGATAGEGNLISGNNGDGVNIQFNSTGNQVKGNFIGTDATGTLDLGNTGVGVEINAFSITIVSNNQIGSATPGEGNTIAFNGRGVLVTATTGLTAGNAIRGNSIFANDNLGIDLGATGVTLNDAGDADTGPNNLQNFPAILSANSDGASTVIQVTLSSTPNTFFNIDFYSSPTADSSAFGEGKVFLGSRPAATQDNGEITFTATFNTPVTIGHFITATAIDLSGNTSEFSEARVVSDASACATLELMPTSASFADAGGSGLININKAAGCAWTAVSNVSWITNVAPASGSGNGAVTYSVAANTSGCRSGTITVGARTFTVYQSCPTTVTMISFTAETYDTGTFLKWQTGFEADNLGFNLYREEAGKRTLVNSRLIAGSALVAGFKSILRAGEAYTWWDSKRVVASENEPVAYWLEDVDLNGQSTWHGPFQVNRIGGKPQLYSSAALLASLGDRSIASSKAVESVAAIAGGSATARATGEQLNQQFELASQPAVKIAVKSEGLYRVSQSELVAAGLSREVDPRLLQLFVDGEEVPITVSSGKDGNFDDSSFIEFYGLGLDTPSTDAQTYWLIEGKQAGKRIPRLEVEGVSSSSESFTRTIERRDRSIYFSSLRNGERENFFGAVITASGVDQMMDVPHLHENAAPPATVEAVLQGVTQLPHRVSVQLNGQMFGEVRFEGQQQGTGNFVVPPALLREGTNSVRLVSLGGPSDVSLVERIRLSYPHQFLADDEALLLVVTGKEQMKISGFVSKAIRVFDVTDEREVKQLIGDIEQERTGTYQVTFAADEAGERKVIALSDRKSKAAAIVKANQPSDLRDEKNAADFVIVTRREFFAALEPLRMVRESEGLSVKLIDVEDVYDEFAYGHKTPQAIRDFFIYAKANWKLAPRYALFVGDASYDPRNYLGFGDIDAVPTKLMDTAMMETASDEWFTDFDEDGVSDLAIGRLPVRTIEEASRLITKILSYRESKSASSALLVSDINDGFDFEGASAELRRLLPSSITVEELKRGQVDGATAKARLLETLKSGQQVVNYVGHGSVNLWRGNLLTTEEARQLANEQLPVFVLMTCLNGYFQDAVTDSLAEALVKAERGGAVAVWASSGMTLPQEQAEMNRAFYRELLIAGGKATKTTPQVRIGEAMQKAKAAVSDTDIRRTWILLGDPAMRLR